MSKVAGGSQSCPITREASMNSLWRLVPLKTTLENGARDSVIQVYVTTVPVKRASIILNLIRKIIPEDGGIDLQHLRRFAKPGEVPQKVRDLIPENSSISPEPDQQLLLLVGSTASISSESLLEALSPLLASVSLFSTSVPLLAPTSQEQAASWASKYWPTVYKKNNPFGPHPSIVSRAGDEIEGDVGKWMDLASQVARQSCSEGRGEEFGVVVVERRGGIARPVAVAGDARWLDWPRVGSGNVTAHAVLRAIATVSAGLKARDEAHIVPENITPSKAEGIFQDKPIGSLERDNCRRSGDSDGYLCHGLEIYCSHEPCVMCSMAIVHSRFGKVVFQQRMSKTGGLCANGKLGHGLFWRKELNWTLLAWQYSQEGGASSIHANSDINV
ncbi:hypothetical protein B7494_g6501 [Chlorociboria aeruginascens]|nr:hypothetical protein B7494_g6501 [Chlorociboria aeruginascens]